MLPISHVLYLHGFRSSPLSTKARLTHAWVRAHRPDLHWWCPQLPGSPAAAMELIMDGIADWPWDRMAVIGSSLGGFYASVVAERTGCRAALLNPAVDPARDLVKYLGEQPAWHDPTQVVEVRLEHMDELRAIAPAAIPRRTRRRDGSARSLHDSRVRRGLRADERRVAAGVRDDRNGGTRVARGGTSRRVDRRRRRAS